MANPDPLRRAARLARRIPGYRHLRRRVVPAVRKNAAARALALRLFAAGPRQAGPTRSDVTAGNLLGGIGVESLPVVVLLLLDTPPERIPSVVEEVAELQVLGAGFRPVFVLDSPTFAPVRRFGYVVELLVARSEWIAEEPRSEYLRRRVRSVLDLYGAQALVTVGPEGLGEGGRAALGAFG